MTEPITLKQVETLAVRLPAKDQLKLLAHLSERLSDMLPAERDGKRPRAADA